MLFVVLLEALVFVVDHNFGVKTQNSNFNTFHEKHFSLGWVAAVSFTIHHHASVTAPISMEQKEEDGFLVLGLAFEGEFQGHGQVPRVAIAPSRAHILSNFV